jgi:hypothetical protein
MKHLLVIFLVLVGTLCTCFGLALGQRSLSSITVHSGYVQFSDEADYKAFQDSLISNNVDLSRVKVIDNYGSTITIQMDDIVIKGDFPYGDVRDADFWKEGGSNASGGYVFLAVFGISMLVTCVLLVAVDALK